MKSRMNESDARPPEEGTELDEDEHQANLAPEDGTESEGEGLTQLLGRWSRGDEGARDTLARRHETPIDPVYRNAHGHRRTQQSKSKF